MAKKPALPKALRISSIDVRKAVGDEPTLIRFGDAPRGIEDHKANCLIKYPDSICIFGGDDAMSLEERIEGIVSGDDEDLCIRICNVEDARNLQKALDKAIELGWLK